MDKRKTKEGGKMNDYEIQKIRDTSFCSGYNTAVSKYEKQNKELQEENAELKELLKKWLQTSKASGCDNINIVTDTEQFLNSEGK